jgi:uncharacterized protein (TIGR00297 family)
MDISGLQIVAQLFSVGVGVFSYYKKSVSVSGLLALLIISGLFIWCNQVGLLFALFYMFASSSLLTKYKKNKKVEFDRVVGKTGPRDYKQAICNLGTAVLGLVIFLADPNDLWVAAILGSIAASNADSWASEIGGLSTQTPVMITNFKPTEKGVSGGVTLLGTIGGIAGSLFIAVFGVVTMHWIDTFPGNLWELGMAVFIAGILGFLFDSYLGAFSQALFIDKNSKQLLENRSSQTQLLKGISWLNNDLVNLITTLVGAVVGGVLYWVLVV